MQKINDNNIVLVVGDMGSSVNFIKNILLLSNNTDWPLFNSVDRLSYFIKEIYPDQLKDNLTNWLNHEYKLRDFKLKYGMI